MQLPIHIIDAFTSEQFKGNQAAVVPLQSWLPDAVLQAIAAENNLSETAFLVWSAEQQAFEIRWFSPLTEIDFCGHATLASAFVLFDEGVVPASEPVCFWAKAVGMLTARREASGRICMIFPRRDAQPLEEPPAALRAALQPAPEQWLVNQQAYMAVYADEATVRALQPDMDLLRTLGPLDVVVTAPADAGAGYDFASRYFWPANGGDEDPVTGSIHAALAPYWAQRLGKPQLTALQASRRSGWLFCTVDANSVQVAGDCVRYLRGEISL